MGVGINAFLPELLLDARIPEILDLVVSPPRQLSCNLRPPVPKDSMELNDEVFFLLRECTSLEVRPQIVYPPQPAALAASLEPCKFRNRTPAAMAMLGYVIHELLILLRGPEPLPQFLLVAARMPPHFSAMQDLGA